MCEKCFREIFCERAGGPNTPLRRLSSLASMISCVSPDPVCAEKPKEITRHSASLRLRIIAPTYLGGATTHTQRSLMESGHALLGYRKLTYV